MPSKSQQEKEIRALKLITRGKMPDLKNFIKLRVEKAQYYLEKAPDASFKIEQGKLKELREQLKLIDFMLEN